MELLDVVLEEISFKTVDIASVSTSSLFVIMMFNFSFLECGFCIGPSIIIYNYEFVSQVEISFSCQEEANG